MGRMSSTIEVSDDGEGWPFVRAAKLCPICQSSKAVGKIVCDTCRKQFTVRIGTIFEDSSIPLGTCILAIYLMCATKGKISARKLQIDLGISHQATWFLKHRISV